MKRELVEEMLKDADAAFEASVAKKTKLAALLAETVQHETVEALLLDAEARCEELQAKCDQGMKDLQDERVAHAETKASLAWMQRQAPVAESPAEEDAEDTAIQNLVASVAAVGADVRALKLKPAAPKPEKRKIRAVVRERDPNGKAMVVDIETVQ